MALLMANNKKIKNAHPKIFNGIKFKSQLEIMTYKILIEQGFSPTYEQKRFVIWEGFCPTIPFLTKNRFKRKNHNIKVLSPFTCKDERPIESITYTPDFTFNYNGKCIIVECKGMMNDVFPYKFKLFRQELEKDPNKQNIELWEIHTKKQLLECIEQLKSKDNEHF